MKRTPLRRVGRRQRRFATADRRAARETKLHPCVCGCPDPPQWAHLESRAYEKTRHAGWNRIPACHALHRWLDRDPQGVQARRVLRTTARELGRMLTAEETRLTLRQFGYRT
ncbi:MAG: hypothetical protein Q8R28_16830 [Dehalococcoidia bacterium]|nr:hypothetical protein [Dehalococcoidia bacterium]